MTPSLEGWPTKAKEAPSRHEVRLAALLDTNPVFQSLRAKIKKEELFSVLTFNGIFKCLHSETMLNSETTQNMALYF